MSINEIEIINIKGISRKSFKVQLLPYKPNLLVAPNGFGKSSLATAFASMNERRIDLADKDYHKEDKSLLPELVVTVDNRILKATNTKNEIRDEFDVLVVNSGLTTKAKKHFKGSVSSNLVVKPIAIGKIPEKAEIIYKVSELRVAFGINGKILPNISELLKNPALVDAVEGLELSKFTQKLIQAALTAIFDKINIQSGKVDDILQWVQNNLADDLRSVRLINDLGQRLVQLSLASSEVEGFLAAYQIASIHSADSTGFNAAIKWLKYTSVKTQYADLLANFKSSNWQWAKIEENEKTLSITFPMAHQLSNGQRDIITLVIQLHKTLYDGSKKPLILIIDEVFDYLDDANLVAFQYYATSIIESYKDRGQVIYPIILTHLDPGVFFDFCFSKHKIQINYLASKPVGKSKNTLKLVELREADHYKEIADPIKESLDQFWFHFHPQNHELPEAQWPAFLPKEWRKCISFHDYVKNEQARYLGNQNYDAIAVCFAVRIAIERLAYNFLSQVEQRNEFIEEHGTSNKLDVVARAGISVPESYYLLGLIYNTNLHWNQGRDYVSPLVSKLEHPTIKQLIASI